MKTAPPITDREQFMSVCYLTPKQLAEKLQVSTVTLWEWRKEGCPYLSLGARSLRYSLPDVVRWLHDRKTASRAV